MLSEHKNEAKAYLVSEVELAGENADVLVSMGSMFLVIGELDLATHCLLKAVDIGSVTANTIKGFRDEMKLDKDCEFQAEACTNADAYYYLGLVSAARGRFEDALQFLAHTLDIRTNDICALRDCAIIYLTMDKLADAAETIDKALGLAGNDPQLKALRRRVWLLQRIEQIDDFLGRFRPWFIPGKHSR